MSELLTEQCSVRMSIILYDVSVIKFTRFDLSGLVKRFYVFREYSGFLSINHDLLPRVILVNLVRRTSFQEFFQPARKRSARAYLDRDELKRKSLSDFTTA